MAGMKYPRLFLFWLKARSLMLRCVGIRGMFRWRSGWMICTKRGTYFYGPREEVLGPCRAIKVIRFRHEDYNG